jgi:hypothetical protein
VGVWIAVIVAAVVVVAVVVVLLLRRGRSTPPPAATAEPAPPPKPEPAPMNDLEAALNQVTDRTGRPIRERIDAEASHVDDLRDPDDTGPLLRRALDSVEHHETSGDPADDPAGNPAGDPPA